MDMTTTAVFEHVQTVGSHRRRKITDHRQFLFLATFLSLCVNLVVPGWPSAFATGTANRAVESRTFSDHAGQIKVDRFPRYNARSTISDDSARSMGGAAAAAATAAAAAAATAALTLAHAACKFAAAIPLRRHRSTNGTSKMCESIGFCSSLPSTGGSSVSSQSSGFLGTSMAGSTTPAVAMTPSAGAGASSMTMMFERFNEKAIRAVMMSQEESRRLGHNYVGPEMLFVGVLAENTGVAAQQLKKLGVTVKDARKALEEEIGRGGSGVQKEIPFTAEAKQALAKTMEECKNMGADAIDPVHILLAVIKQKDDKVNKILEKLKVDPAAILSDVEGVLREKQEKEGELVSVGGPKKKSEGKQSVLEEFGKDLTKAASEGLMDPLVGREHEIERTIQILARRQKNNPVLIGEPGVGKTAIAEGLAMRIATGDVPDLLQGKRVIELDLGMLVSGTKYRGEFEERMKNIIKEAQSGDRNIILMIDEIHTLVGAGGGGDGGGGAMDAANIMKPALSRGELQVIGATTVEEYRKYVAKDKALERRFQPVTVPEPTVDETVQILRGIARKYESHHKLRYSEESLVSCVQFASQYITDRFLPDKAIDVMDETGARVQLKQLAKIPEGAHDIRSQMRDIQEKKEAAVRLQDFDSAAQLREEEISLQKQIRDIMVTVLQEQTTADESEQTEAVEEVPDLETLFAPVVTENDVASVVSTWTGVPVEKVNADESVRLIALEDTLHDRVIGQEEAVVAVSKAVRRARAGLKNPNRPIASFIFCGPTGVGKTELCKALSEAYFGKEEAMIRLDMSEFMERHTVSKLIGSPPGYVGYDEESMLTDGVRRKPYSLVLFDEVEKAHPDVFNLMLQVLEDGHLTDSKGRRVSFKNTLIIMTSNVGAKAIEKTLLGAGDIGFSGMDGLDDAKNSSYARLKSMVHDELKTFFRPEFLNRLDEIIVFRSLTKPEVSEIAELEFRKTFKRCQERGITLSLTERFKVKVVDEGFNPVYGARPLRRAIMRLLEDNLAESFLTEQTVEGECVICDVDKNGEVIVLREQLPDVESDQTDSLHDAEEVEAKAPQMAMA